MNILRLAAITLASALSVSPAFTQTTPADPAPAGLISYSIPERDSSLTRLRTLLWETQKRTNVAALSPIWSPWMTGVELSSGGDDPEIRRAVWMSAIEKIRIAKDGYVSVNQHYSHAHDDGWPFPMWPQIYEPNWFEGYTAGWHFQDETEGFAKLFYMEPIIRPKGHAADEAINGWELADAKSNGRPNKLWQIEVNGKSPMLTTGPAFHGVLADCAPFLQIRYRGTPELPDEATIAFEWKGEGDADFSPERRIEISAHHPDPWERASKLQHCLVEAWKHPGWKGKISAFRFILPPGAAAQAFEIDSIFTAFDTRHSVTNTGLLIGAAEYFRWTGNTKFLAANIERMRTAMRFCRGELGGDEYKFIRVPWVGHDGRPGYTGTPTDWKRRYGGGIGNNYWDLLPFGSDDFYATTYFYSSLEALAEVETWIEKEGAAHQIAPAKQGENAAALLALAAEVKTTANKHFWNEKTGRFIGWIDRDGVPYDYGLTFVNLEAIHYGIATDEHARKIMDWVSGDRIVEGDTSTGADIYRWRFAPRSTTLRNDLSYFWAWPGMDKKWGEQVQDGGAVLGFGFFDLTSRLRYRGAKDAGTRMDEMLGWLDEVENGGGVRAWYSADPARGTLQGGGTEGGLGVDVEFVETALWPHALLTGFAGFRPTADGFVLDPQLPPQWPSLTIRNVAYRSSRLTLTLQPGSIEITVQGSSETPLHVQLPNKQWSGPQDAVLLKDGAKLIYHCNAPVAK